MREWNERKSEERRGVLARLADIDELILPFEASILQGKQEVVKYQVRAPCRCQCTLAGVNVLTYVPRYLPILAVLTVCEYLGI